MKAYAITDAGIVRNINQDYIYYSLESIGCLPNLFIICRWYGRT